MTNKQIAIDAKNACRVIEQQINAVLHGPDFVKLRTLLIELADQYDGENEEIKHLEGYLNGNVGYALKESKKYLQKHILDRLNDL